MTAPPSRCGAETGVALVTVVVVLVAMALIATPFAVSMRHLESGALLSHGQVEARAGALAALAAARRHLEDTHPYYDLDTPHDDSLEEIAPPDLDQRYADLLPRDPRGSVRSVSIEDEQGKVHLGTASVWLLGNLVGGRSFLTAPIGADADTLALASTEGFASSGLALVGGEQVEYSVLGDRALQEVRRGFPSANISRSLAASHPIGTPVLDARLALLVQRCWHVRPGVWQPYLRVGGLKDLALFAEMVYRAEDLDRVADDLTVHGGPVRWRNPQRLVGTGNDRDGLRQIHVPDGSRFGPGAVLQLENLVGQKTWNLVLAAVDWEDHWRLSVLEELDPRMRPEETVVTSLVRDPVSLATASPRVLEALLRGVGRAPHSNVITTSEAAHLALAIVERGLAVDGSDLRRELEGDIEAGDFDELDVTTAARVLADQGPRRRDDTVEELGELLVGQRTRRTRQAIGAATAQALAEQIAAGRPRSHEQLASLLAGAVADGVCAPEDRENILRCALDPDDARLSGGTAPFTYASGGLFTIEAAAIQNQANGRERSRAHVRQILSPGLPGESARLIDSQRDFEAGVADRGRPGWTSWPHQLETGPGQAPSPPYPVTGDGPPRHRRDEQADLPIDQRGALALGASGTDRASDVVAGRIGPSDAEELSWVAPAPVRSHLADTVHFDEGAWGLLGATPSGYELATAPFELEVEALQPRITGRSTRLLTPFSVEFWFELDDTGAETLLFDSGAHHTENHVFIKLLDGELVFRVSDTSITDFDSVMPEGRLPPAGEIRYAFDDGLELRPGVPYHVLAWVGGARDTQMVLLVDGVPRGQRSFTTRLTAEMGIEGFAGNSAALGSDPVMVESTAGFPERGVLRIGREIVEYVDKDDHSFNVRPVSASDPFGGRARRGTTGTEHEVSELVELVGYSRALASSVANKGNGTLDGRLAAFDFAEIDPIRATDEIYVQVTYTYSTGTVEEPLLIGTGIDYTNATIPVRSYAGASLDGVFQTGGGHAVIFCDYGNGAVFGQPLPDPGGGGAVARVPFRTVDDAWLGGAEVIRYETFDGTTLQGCSRHAAGIPKSVGPDPSPLEGASNAYISTQGTKWDDTRAWVTSFSPELVGTVDGLPDEARVIVIPISVAIDGGDLYENFHPQMGDLGADSFLVQLGLDFPEGGGGTEWVRWTTPTAGALVRDDPSALDDMLQLPAGSDIWRMDTAVPASYPEGLNDRFDFRGQDGTPDTDHETTDEVLPTIVFGTWGVEGGFEPALGIPGRHDATTLMGDDGLQEWHIVNHASNNDTDWGNAYVLVGFREPVTGDFGRTPMDADESYPLGDIDFKAMLREGGLGDRLMEELQLEDRQSLLDTVRSLQADSRMITRLVKAPSGELPGVPLGEISFGQDFDRRPSRGGARIDELRLSVSDLPGPLLPGHARYRLSAELVYEEDEALTLSVQELLYPQARVRRGLLGKDGLEILSELPQNGGLLLVGEEIMAYAGLDPVETGAVFLTGRALYGTARAYHAAGEPVIPLTFWPASPLGQRIDEDDSVIPVADPAAFPAEGGLVWVGDELIGYDALSDEGLVMPVRPGRGLGIDRGYGLLRGRFGTVPAAHDAGTMVRWQPMRVADQALAGEDVPEAHGLRLGVRAPGAFFTDVALNVVRPDPLVELDARVVLDDLVSPHADPTGQQALFAVPIAEKTPGTRVLGLGRQADLLELHFMARWLPGAFDARDFASNAWKVGPRVETVVVRHVQPSMVLSHEEWR